MAFPSWEPTLSVGVPALDAQHQTLMALANVLHDANARGLDHGVLGSVLEELAAYASAHFAVEEHLMREHGYPGLTPHLAEHRQLVARVVELRQEIRSGRVPPDTVMDFLRHWISVHIMEADRKYRPYLARA